MTVADFIKQVRYQINDTQAVEYTDEELINYINIALSWLSNELISLSAPLLLKETTLTLTNGEAPLPPDFVREAAVIAGKYVLNSLPPILKPDQYSYTIVGDTLKSQNEEVRLYYYAGLGSVSATTDTIPAPGYMLNLLREIVIFLALNRNEYNTNIEQALTQAFGQQVAQIAVWRGGSNFEPILPWKV